MTKLIVCCDGTWNHPNEEQDGVPTPTNVVRLFNAIKDQPDQVKYYHPGVGTEGNWWDKIAGGAFGSGLGKNVQSAYKWLATKYQAGDQIFLVGFSRGAFTVRSLAGMIKRCGLLNLGGLDDDEIWARVETAYKGYRKKQDRDVWGGNWQFHESAPGDKLIPIHFLGVWDTVGALGIPDDLAILSLLDNRENYAFHDAELSDTVECARHAVAIDERRASFFPTLWSNADAHKDAKQVWFPGVHSDVGGGYPETGLSDGALKWMIDEATAGGLVFDHALTQQVAPKFQDVLHDSCKGPWKLLRTQPRSVPLLEPGKAVHDSAIKRKMAPPITQAPYRKSIPLKVGEEREIAIYAATPWNETGIYIDKGAKYKFTATGQWVDRSIKCGPKGTSDGSFYPGEVAQVLLSVWGKVEKAFGKVTGNDQADFKGTKRYEDADWFELLGVVANAGIPNHDGTPPPLTPIRVTRLKGNYTHVADSGYLYCFANDAWNFYDNNKGSVTLTVKRIS